MTIVCNVCGYDQNTDDAEFCDACGAELTAVVTTPSFTPSSPPVEEDFEIPTPSFNSFTPSPSPMVASTARLVAKQPNAPIPEFLIESSAIIGIFDPDTGPVDIDLENFLGNETVSRNHAEIYTEGDVWKIKDLGSTNGVFIKPINQTRYGARITAPESLKSGDEIAIAKIRFLFQSP
ncbi:FHA domain-containing protein [Gloeothece verrucosa]|uniref:FHA domain containing protein n=1 Tax=Gloeothece verrucosa (strain PCC 7822) TaxID=497965 RepID=E0UMJ0_GLOV7|nr:FHA domain-containing protein [Gloeothece verrucosa]ADN18170.1 FHA domain containing protein [Gloeothece verrucosa PCC 7822]